MTACVTRRFPLESDGDSTTVNIKKVIRERIRESAAGVDLDADVNAVVAANVGERGQTTSVSSSSRASASSRPKERVRDDEPRSGAQP